ncbi:MAG: Asp-tRNA(Asn)/Glu-tRNA(Gln) amidotransferase subunit GatB [Ignavibacteria bacterium]|nr:Asp-tRNA(Asn)/Glu-tRNA(Gln) amidotransferase subunit GatB [Ignavibacteria bacterium]
MNFEAVIGLEIHAQLLTDSKLFCGCSTKFGNPPNTNVCPVCMGHPGVLPVLNKKAVEYTIKMGLATNCTINRKSVFARKNYFYPDLPKGYQISQYEFPLCSNGYLELEIENEKRKIRINRIHLEEDAGKSIHDQGPYTLLDFNRCGVPLIEIVTAPDLRSPEEAGKFLTEIRQIVKYLGICDGNMEEGSLRCDANVSIREKGSDILGTKTEVKNMNSIRYVVEALKCEIDRQIEILSNGGKIEQQTLLWNSDKQTVEPMRSKEESHDYRYFPEPDLPQLELDEIWLESIRKTLPELPSIRKLRLKSQYNLPDYDVEILTTEKEWADYFEETAKHTNDYKAISNWFMTEILKIINEEKISIQDFVIKPEWLAELINSINNQTISGKIAKEVFNEMLSNPQPPQEIIKNKGLVQITDENEIIKVVEKVLNENQKQVEQYLSGKEKVFAHFVGQVMKETKGKANPGLVNKILNEKLNALKSKN